jgi:hypothetical protein
MVFFTPGRIDFPVSWLGWIDSIGCIPKYLWSRREYTVNRFAPNLTEVAYHITVRLAQQKYWLQYEDVKLFREQMLARLAACYYVEILSHCVMSNQIHIVLKMHRPEMLLKDVRHRFELLQQTK